MQQHIHTVCVLCYKAKEVGDGVIVCYVQIANRGIFAKGFFYELGYAILKTFTLIIEDELCAGFVPCFCDTIGNAALVGNTCDDTDLAC